MPKHMDVEMVVAAESILRLVCVLVPVASLVRVDLDVLEWPLLDIVMLVLNATIAFIQIIAWCCPSTPRKTIVK